MLPLMGLGTFIGCEDKIISDIDERMATVESTVFNALAIGYRHIDLAQNYGNLPAIGRAIKRALSPENEGGLALKREELWLTMKSDNYSLAAIEDYITELNCGYLDTFTLHFPFSCFSNEIALMRTWKAITELPTELVKTVGVSNFYAGHIERLLQVCDKYQLPKPFSNEVESNILCPNDEVIKLCQSHDIQVIAYSPLGFNLAENLTSDACMFGNTLFEVAESIGATAAQTALAWLMARNIAVIPKSTQLHRLAENYDASRHVASISKDICKKLEQMHTDMPSITGAAGSSFDQANALSWTVIARNSEPRPVSVFFQEPSQTLVGRSEMGNNNEKAGHSGPPR